MEVLRHPCGLYYSRSFADYLREKHENEADLHPGEVLWLDYVSCAEGENAGSAWYRLAWVSLFSEMAGHTLEIAGIRLALHQQTRRGLKNRLLHYADGQVYVKR